MKTSTKNISEPNSVPIARLQKYIEEKPEGLLDNNGDISDEILFMVLTREFPSKLTLSSKIDKKRFYEMLNESTKFNATSLQELNLTKKKNFLTNSKKEINFIIIINNDILVSTGNHFNSIFYGKNADRTIIDEILVLAQCCRKEKKPKEDHFFMITKEQFNGGMSLKHFQIKPYDIDLKSHYNDDFIEIDKSIQLFLNNSISNGIVLLHGKPGTGKTSYIRYLIKSLDKRVIYLPMHLMDVLSDPGFLEFMAEYKDSILILEDCEDILKHRKDNSFSNPSLTNLLNLGDGLLSDALCIKVICTFNADLQKIDRAILRKGRLIARYEFSELTTFKTQNLLTHLGKNHVASNPMTLADIYNVETTNFHEVETSSKIGFVTQKE